MDFKSAVAFPMEPPAIRRHRAEDLISGLPDELLHAILVRLPSAQAAARTSVLSRRWRGVWAHMPELVFCNSPARATPTTPSVILDSVDAALNSYAAPTLNSLKIDLKGFDWCDVDANRIAPWLRCASQRLTGKLCLSLHTKYDVYRFKKIEDEVALPICERATEIDITLRNKFALRLPPTGSFSCLTDLKISWARMDGGELGRVVSSPQCPRLRKLGIFQVSLGRRSFDVSICSESLQCLDYDVEGISMLQVKAPELQAISVSIFWAAKACIVAPKLQNITWSSTFNPDRHQFDVARRHLNSLSIMHNSFFYPLISSTRLMERYDTVKEMTISLRLYQDIEAYMTFLKETDKLPVCETLVINLVRDKDGHGLLPKMLHLLKRCSCIRKFKLLLSQGTPSKTSCNTSGCPCLLPESYKSDDITLDSLVEIGIGSFTGTAEQLQFIEVLLSRCNMVTLKRLDITVLSTPVSLEIIEFVESIRTMYNKVQLNLLTREVQRLAS